MFSRISWAKWLAVVLIGSLLQPILAVSAAGPCDAAGGPGVSPISPNGQQPSPVPNTCVVAPSAAVNQPVAQSEADSAVQFANLSRPDPTRPTAPTIGNGERLFDNPNACLDFNTPTYWKGSTWSRQYAGWGMSGFDDGNIFHKVNLTFDQESHTANVNSLKIDGDKPFRGLIVGPLFNVPADAEVVARVSYFIRNGPNDHKRDDNGLSASIRVKAGPGATATVNPPTVSFLDRGIWRQMESRMTMGGQPGKVFVILQANNLQVHSSVAVYFDNVEIWVNGQAMTQCLFED